MVYFITGKSGAGKTTLAYKMAFRFVQEGKPVLVLDGANIRKWFPKASFSDRGREQHILMVAKWAAIAEEQRLVVIVELFAPKKAWRIAARNMWKESQLIYLPGGTVWKGTTYEEPTREELVAMFR